MNQNQRTVKKKAAALLTLLALLLMALLVAAAPALAGQETTGPTPTTPEETTPPAGQETTAPTPAGEETVTVTFELTVDGEVPEGYSLYLSGNRADPPSQEPFGWEFCHTDRPGEGFVTCEDGGTYSQAYEVPRGSTLSYQYAWRDLYPTPGGGTPNFGNFFTEQRTFTEDATVSVTYTGTGEPPPSVEETDLMAQLTAECPENAATLAGYQLVTTGVEAQTAVPLTDEDGDGVLTGTQTFPRFPPGPQPPADSDVEPITVPDVRIVAPDGSTVQQFGPVRLDQDEIILPATISFCDDGGDGGNGGNGDDGDGGGSDGNGGSDGGGFLSGLLPETGGGWAVLLLIVGAVLLGGGWLLVRRFSAG